MRMFALEEGGGVDGWLKTTSLSIILERKVFLGAVTRLDHVQESYVQFWHLGGEI